MLLTLKTFSATGGIEKVCRIMGKALYEYSIENTGIFELCSMYDRQEDAADNPYFPSEYFRGFGVQKLRFTGTMLKTGRQYDTVILSHINLLPVGWLIKKTSPATRLILLAHGIEIWEPLGNRKTNMLKACDDIASVSHFTRDKIISVHGIDATKCSVLNNCLDPFLPLPSVVKKNSRLMEKYGFAPNDLILMTLTRLSSKERYKGYDKVIEALAALAHSSPVKYLIAGSYDKTEKQYLTKLIEQYGLQKDVVLAGFIPDEELEDHFAMADVYIMPSKKEGFGIVFIEAMYYGLPVIAGNVDGSVDALLNGDLGQLVNPDDIDAIKTAILNIVSDKKAFMPNRELLQTNFGYVQYKRNLENLLER